MGSRMEDAMFLMDVSGSVRLSATGESTHCTYEQIIAGDLGVFAPVSGGVYRLCGDHASIVGFEEFCADVGLRGICESQEAARGDSEFKLQLIYPPVISLIE